MDQLHLRFYWNWIKMDKEKTKTELIDFMQKELQIPVKDSFIFFDDTEIDGVDAFELMYNFGIGFNVNMSDFDQYSYFTSEKDLMNLPKRIFMRIKKGKMRTFDLNHLVEVVIKGKWFDSDNI